MIRAVYSIDVSAWLDTGFEQDRRDHRLVDAYLNMGGADTVAVEIHIGNRQPPIADQYTGHIEEYWRDLATLAPHINVKGGAHVKAWEEFLALARERDL